MREARTGFIVGWMVVALTAAPLDADSAVPDRPPGAPSLKPPTTPTPFSARLDNGMEVLVVSDDKLPYVTVGWQLRAGARFDPPDKPGVAMLTADLLREGTNRRSSSQIAERIDSLAITYTSTVDHERTEIFVGGLREYLDQAVELLAETIRQPTFPPDEVDRLKAEAKSALSIAEADPAHHGQLELARRIFGSHYRSRPADGTTESLARIVRDDVAAFYKKRYGPDGSVLIFSGAVDSDQAMKLANEHFASWPASPSQSPADVDVPSPSATHIYLVDWPDASQSQIFVGHASFKRTDPDYECSLVFNQIFAGGFSGRLVKSIRSEKGLTYGAGGGFQAFKDAGQFVVRTFTRNEKTAETLQVILREIERIRNEPASRSELTDARYYLIGRYGLEMETPQQVARRILTRRFHDLPDDYEQNYLSKIASTSAADVLRFAREKLLRDRLVIVVVGNAKEISASLESVAPVTIAQPQ